MVQNALNVFNTTTHPDISQESYFLNRAKGCSQLEPPAVINDLTFCFSWRPAVQREVTQLHCILLQIAVWLETREQGSRTALWMKLVLSSALQTRCYKSVI